MKRLLCVLLLALLLCGCGAPAEETLPSETTQPAPPKEISVYLSDEICDQTTWRSITDAFTAATGIPVIFIGDPAQAEVVHLPREQATDFLSANPAASLPELPETVIPGEDVTVASKALAGTMDSFAAFPDTCVQFLPIFCGSYGLGYNAALFEEKGWSVPTTWEELWELGEAAKADNRYLFTYTDAAQLTELMYAALYSVGGPDFFRSAAQYAEGIWSGDTGRACAGIMAKLAGYTHPMTASNMSAQAGQKNLAFWLQNEVLFFPAGRETAASILPEEKAEGFQLGIAPVMSAGRGQYVYLDTQRIWISGRCENPASAIRFLAFLYSDTAAGLFRKAGLEQPIVLSGEAADGWLVAAGSFLPYHAAVGVGSVREVFLDPFGQMINGTVTAEEWIRNTESAATAIRGSLKNE